MTVHELNTLYTVCELKRNQLLTSSEQFSVQETISLTNLPCHSTIYI